MISVAETVCYYIVRLHFDLVRIFIMQTYKFKEVTAEMWSDFETLFGNNGACGGCWCQHWRVWGSKAWDDIKGDNAKEMTRQLFAQNQMTGLLAYDGDKAVGWCSYGPREVYNRIEKTRPYRRDDTAGVWSINCFFIDKKYRRKGLSRLMLAAAVNFIKKSNNQKEASLIEGYPTPLTKAGKKLPGAFSFTGPLKIFEDAGFKIIQRESYSRPLVRLEL